MSGILGLFYRDGRPALPDKLGIMQQAMAVWGRDASKLLKDGCVGMGHLRTFSTPESYYDDLPLMENGILFTAGGRVDNREELIADCGLRIAESEKSEISDGEIIFHAYLKWGEDCPERIYGDWSFAAWHPKERRLFLARDHHGNTSLYYYADPGVFAFASSYKALLALNLAPVKMDELYLAQVLVSWPAYHGERSIYSPIKRLPPGHCLAITPDRIDVRRYWRLEETAELRLPKMEDYAEAFLEIFDNAVQSRIRTAGNIGVSLSGGLDSGSVAVTAARLLREKDKPLLAFTSAPLSDTSRYEGKRFGDESSFARATAQHAGNIKWHPVTAASISPIQAIRRMLAVRSEPGHSAVNLFWMHSIREAAFANGCRVLLIGAAGNGGISWAGSIFSQSIGFQLHTLGLRQWSKEAVKRYAPVSLLNAYRRMRTPKDGWWKSSAIHPDFAGRLNLFDRMLDAPDSNMVLPLRNPRELRYRLIKPGNSILGSLQAEIAAAYGLSVRDPTADARVLAFTISVPDDIFIDQKTGMNRMLIRTAMKGRLPDEVRLNRNTGIQAADIVPRLRVCAGEVEEALNELQSGPAAAYVDVPYMYEVWRMIQTQDTPEAFRKAVTVITRGIMAGLFVNYASRP